MIYIFSELDRRSPALEFPNWMQQPSIGCIDLTDLECMAIPSREASEATIKSEAILTNLQQRYKKDQIYVSLYQQNWENNTKCKGKFFEEFRGWGL